MKIAAIAVAATIAATTASAAQLGATGISIGAELDTYYDFDAEATQSVLTPTVGFAAAGVDFSASTDLTLIENDSLKFDTMLDNPVITLGAGYTLNMGVAARAYGEVDIDQDFDTSGAKAGIKFSF